MSVKLALVSRGRLALFVTLLVAAATVIGVASFLGKEPASQGCPDAQTVQGAQNVEIVASVDGFNGSALSPYSVNGVPQVPWPVIHVAKGTLVNITVCNVDKQAHGFQISHYFDTGIETIAPGQSIHVSFVANETGTFKIYCSIFCTVHWAMQNGQLIVS